MSLQVLKIVKSWILGNDIEVADFNNIVDPIVAWSVRSNNNLKQIGLDIGGSSYDFNNDGKATQATSILDLININVNNRLTALESGLSFGFKNLGFDFSTSNIVKLVSANGTDLSATNFGTVNFNSSANPGQVVSIQVTANISINLTGAHWGQDTLGDLTNAILWIYLMNDLGTIRMGVAKQGGRESIITTDVTNSAASATIPTSVLADSLLLNNSNVICIAYVKANFDDTGNGGGENFWSVQTGVGAINLGPHFAYFEGSFKF